MTEFGRLPKTFVEKHISVFGRPFVKPFAICYQIVVSPVCLSVWLSVSLVYCCQTLRWIKMKLGMRYRTRPWPHCIRRGPRSPCRKRLQPPIFGPYLLWPNGSMD